MQRACFFSKVVRRRAAGTGMLLAAFQLGGCGQSTLPPPPAGIVSLNPCTDAILTQVASPNQIRALSAYSSRPNASSMDVAVAQRFPSTTGTVEEIAALRPAIVVSGNFTPPATRQALVRLNIRLVEFPIATNVEESIAQVRQIAAIAGHPERGDRLAWQISAAVQASQPDDRDVVPALVWQSGGIVAGDETLIADLLSQTGFVNAAAARGLKQAEILPLERVLADPPKVILSAGDGTGENRMLTHPALAKLKQAHRAKFDSRLLWCGGPTIIKAAQRLAEVRKDVVGNPARGMSE